MTRKPRDRDLFGTPQSKLSPGAAVRAWREERAKATAAAERQRLERPRAERKSKFEWDLRDVSEGGDVVWDKGGKDES